MKPRFPGKKGKRFLAKTKVLDESCCHVLNMLQFFSHVNSLYEQKNQTHPNKSVRQAVLETMDYFLAKGHTEFLKNFQKFPFVDKTIEFDGSKPQDMGLLGNTSKKNFSELAKAVQGSCKHCKGLIACAQQGLSVIYDSSSASLDNFVIGASWNCCPSSPSSSASICDPMPNNDDASSPSPSAISPQAATHQNILARLAELIPGTYLDR